MVFYEAVVTTKWTTHFHDLTRLVKNMSLEIVNNGGVVRAVHNHGVRDLPHRFKARYRDAAGKRYFRKGRFFSVYYESNPEVRDQVEQICKLNEEVLRSTTLKARSILDVVNVQVPKKNPFLTKEHRHSGIDFEKVMKKE